MKKKARESKLNVALTVVLVTFVCALAFSVGVVSGKGWSDREYALKTIDGTSRVTASAPVDEQNTPLSEDLTEKEVELLTAKALEEARNNPAEPTNETDDLIAEMKELDRLESLAKGEKPAKVTDKKPSGVKEKRRVASVAKKPTMPKPSEIEYTVQVASYKSKGEAEEHSQKLIEKGFPAFPVSAKVKGQTWYRVSVGSFVSRNAAVKYERDLKKQAIIKNSIVQKVRR